VILANLVLRERAIPEFLQDECTADNIACGLEEFLATRQIVDRRSNLSSGWRPFSASTNAARRNVPRRRFWSFWKIAAMEIAAMKIAEIDRKSQPRQFPLDQVHQMKFTGSLISGL